MRRLMVLVAAAVVAGAMYVAAAPGGQRSAGPTARQFKALKSQVATLAKKLKATQTDLNGLATVYVVCSLHSEVGVIQRSGYAGTSATTALDLEASAPTYVLTPFNSGEQACQSLIGLGGLRHHVASRLVRQFGR